METTISGTVPEPAAGRSAGLVVFDIGEVLVGVDAAACPRYLADATGLAPEKVSRLLYDSGLYDRFDTGALSTEELLAELLRAVLGAPELSAQHVAAAWCAGIKVPCPVLAPIAARLAEAERMVYATNNNPIHLPIVLERLAEAGVAGGVPEFVSFQVGVRKPDSEFFRILRGVLPGPCTVFIDDRAENVLACENAGLPAFHHTDPAATAAFLARLGVLGQDWQRVVGAEGGGR
jgi:glucose-1-phosphatase